MQLRLEKLRLEKLRLETEDSTSKSHSTGDKASRSNAVKDNTALVRDRPAPLDQLEKLAVATGGGCLQEYTRPKMARQRVVDSEREETVLAEQELARQRVVDSEREETVLPEQELAEPGTSTKLELAEPGTSTKPR